MDRGDDAKKRLAALHQPIPRPTKAAVKLNREEEESRRESTTLNRLMGVVKKGPDVAQASKVGNPTLVDPTPVAATQVAGETVRRALGLSTGDHNVSVETVKTGAPGANEPAPRSDAPPVAATGDPFAHTAPATPDANELKPSADASANTLKPAGQPDPNELTPSVDAAAGAAGQPLPPPVQVNEIQQGQPASSSPDTANAASSSSLASDQEISSSKKKKKKGMKKVMSF
jgi:hypothetical protein